MKFDLDENYQVYLEVMASSEATINIRVLNVPKKENFWYKERTLLGKYSALKGSAIKITTSFSFSNVLKPNLDDAIKHTSITYKLIAVKGPIMPFKDFTSEDLDSKQVLTEIQTLPIN